MEIKDVQKDKTERKTVNISLRTYPKYAKFMKDNNISPNALFNKALEEMMKKKK